MSFRIEPRRADESLDAWSRRVSGAFVGRQQAAEIEESGGVRGLLTLAQQLGREHDVSFTDERGRNPGRPCPTCGEPETCRIGRLALGVAQMIFVISEGARNRRA